MFTLLQKLQNPLQERVLEDCSCHLDVYHVHYSSAARFAALFNLQFTLLSLISEGANGP